MKRVFISYAHEDVAFRDALAVHLQVLCTAGIITSWSDGEIGPGEDWKAAIERELQTADIIVLLVSASFLASRSCQELELSPALQRWKANEVTVVPVIVRACDWDASPLARLQVLPPQAKPVATWSHQDDAWTEVTRRIRATTTHNRHQPGERARRGANHASDHHARLVQPGVAPSPTSIDSATFRGAADSVSTNAMQRTSVGPATPQSTPLAASASVHSHTPTLDLRLRRQAMLTGASPGVIVAIWPTIRLLNAASTADAVASSAAIGALLACSWISSVIVKGSRTTSKSTALKTGISTMIVAAVVIMLGGIAKSCL